MMDPREHQDLWPDVTHLARFVVASALVAFQGKSVWVAVKDTERLWEDTGPDPARVEEREEHR